MSRFLSTSTLQRVRSTCAVLTVAALLVPAFSAVMAQNRPAEFAEEQQILHVLNRLGFGARPGDIEHVKKMGISNYVTQQLNPQQIPDSLAEAKLKQLPTLSMSSAQLYEKYPQPGMLVRQLERRGELPAELAEAQKKSGTENVDTSKRNDAPEAERNAQENETFRRAIRAYYAENGLQLPQRVIGELQASRILRAVYSERQLNEVMVDFWTNHFNVFAGKGADRWLLTSYDRDTIRPHAMGKFSDLLIATAKSPAMLFYLDNFQSVSPNAPLPRPGSRLQPLMNREGSMGQRPAAQPAASVPRMRRGINENYARELMELHTLGVDGGYTQKDVQEVARCFTGWTIFAPRGGAAAGPRLGEFVRENAGKFFFNPRVHDDGEKILLGNNIRAGGGFKDGLIVLDILARHPSTAKFIARKLVRHFVSDNPPEALVTRVAHTFTESDGDIRESLRAIFFSPEFNSLKAYRAKVKRPFELAISAIRSLGGDTNGGPQFHRWIARMGEPLYGFQTPNGYSDTAESWVNAGGLLERLNFGLALAGNRIPGTRVNLRGFLNGSNANGTNKSVDRLLDQILAGDVSSQTRQTLIGQIAKTDCPTTSENSVGKTTPPAGPQADDTLAKIVGLILGSPEFQRQ